MAIVSPKAIYVGPPQLLSYLERIKPEWQFAGEVPDIQALWAGLDDESIDSESHVLIFFDGFFDPQARDTAFEKAVATMAPHCLVAILSYTPDQQDAIAERVNAELYASGNDSSSNYYFVDYKQPVPTLNNAIEKFVRETSNRELAAILSGREYVAPVATYEEPKEVAPVAQMEAYNLEDDEEYESDTLGQVVAVTSSKGGSGKSTVAITLATYLAHASANSVRERLEEKPLKIVILDLDVRDGQLGFITGNSSPTVVNIRLNGISPETVSENTIHSPRLKVDLLLAPKRPRHAEDTPPNFYVDLIRTLRRQYDYVILDTSVNYLDPLLEKVAYPTADQIVFVTDIVVNSVFSMTRWIMEVTKSKEQNGMGISRNKIGIVVNKSLSGVAMPGDKIARSAMGIPVIAAIPSNPKVMAHAANIQSMELLLEHDDIRLAVRRLARAVVGKKYKLSENVKP